MSTKVRLPAGCVDHVCICTMHLCYCFVTKSPQPLLREAHAEPRVASRARVDCLVLGTADLLGESGIVLLDFTPETNSKSRTLLVKTGIISRPSG